MRRIKRAYQALLKEYLSIFPCVAIIGPRQCGKTTFLNELPKKWHRFDLENQADFEVISRDPGLFLRLNPDFVAIDESQICPSLFPALRVAIDQKRNRKGRFVVTGSSSPELIRSLSESLAGRVGFIEMSPFSCHEAYDLKPSTFFRGIKEKRSLVFFQKNLRPRLSLKQTHKYWWEGGYPEPWLNKKKRFHEVWMSQYLKTYIERDIARLFPKLNKDRFRLFFNLLSGLSGTIVNYSDVGRSLGVSPPTIRDYFQIAHGSFLWRNIPSFDKNPLKRIVKHPRGYLRDTGLLHHLLKIPDLISLYSHPKMGASWEGLVIETILRGLHTEGIETDTYYYRTGAGAEIDLILDGSFGLIPIEIKYSQSIKTSNLRSLSDFIKEKKCRLGFVVNNDQAVRLYSEKIIGIPFSALA